MKSSYFRNMPIAAFATILLLATCATSTTACDGETPTTEIGSDSKVSDAIAHDASSDRPFTADAGSDSTVSDARVHDAQGDAFSGPGLSAAASRVSGVAPLSVHFNAYLEESTPTSKPFHHNKYVWDFGDTASGDWAPTHNSKNVGHGAVAAHVYETAGTFTATLTVFDSATGNIVANLANSFLADPDNSDVLSRDFSLTAASSAAIDKGYKTPLLDDFLRQIRSGVYDLGPFEFGGN